MWTKKERFEAVLNHELADRPPVSAWRHFTENEHSGADLFEIGRASCRERVFRAV